MSEAHGIVPLESGVGLSVSSLLLAMALALICAANNVGVLVGASIRAKMITPHLAKRMTAFLYLAGALTLGGRFSKLLSEAINYTSTVSATVSRAVVIGQGCVLVIICFAWWLVRLPVACTQILFSAYLAALWASGVGLDRFNVGFIAMLWVFAPVLTLGLTNTSRKIAEKRVWARSDPLASLLGGLPLFFAFAMGVYVSVLTEFGIFAQWTSHLSLSPAITIPSSLGTGLIVSILTYYLCYYFAVPAMKKWVFAQFQETWQDYLPKEDVIEAAQRTSMEQRGVVAPASRASSITSGKVDEKGASSVGGRSLSRIRAEEAFGYPQLFALGLLLLLDGGILFAAVTGPVNHLLAPHYTTWNLICTALTALSLSLGVLLLSDSSLSASIAAFFTDLPASASFHMELGSLLPALAGLAFGVPVSAGQCKLVVLLVWMAWIRRGSANAPEGGMQEGEQRVLWRVLLVWFFTLLLATGLPGLIAYLLTLYKV